MTLPYRTSGRDLTQVRRPRKPAPPVDLGSLKKDELVQVAEQAGVDATGTKAEILERLEGGSDG